MGREEGRVRDRRQVFLRIGVKREEMLNWVRGGESGEGGVAHRKLAARMT